MTRAAFSRMGMLFLTLLCARSIGGQKTQPVTVLSARRTPVYHEVFQAIVAGGMEGKEVFLEDNHPSSNDMCGQGVIALGPTARQYLNTCTRPCTVLWALCLGPDKEGFPGITLLPDPQAQMRLLKEGTPFRRLGLIFNSKNTGWWVRDVEKAAKSQGLMIVKREVKDTKSAIWALRGIRTQVDAIFLVPDTTVLKPSFLESLVTLSTLHNVPVIGFAKQYLRKGAVLSMGLNPQTVGGLLVESWKSGRENAPLFSRKFDVWVNQERMREMGLSLDLKKLQSLAQPKERSP